MYSTEPMEVRWRFGLVTRAPSPRHTHEFDEYMRVVEGCYTLLIDRRKIELRAGEEFCIPRGVSHAGEVVAGTRTIHAFGGRRAERVNLGSDEALFRE